MKVAAGVSSDRAFPSGTVTFLFSDIEGSTQRWEAYHQAMQRAVASHDALMRAAIEKNRGHIFKTVGDAFCAAFSSPSDAVAAAIDAQRALRANDWSDVHGLRVRIAIHSGDCELRDGDYFGPTVNRTARLVATGHGGQVLVSGVARALAEDQLPSEISLLDLGRHRLKDLTQPEHVYQVLAPDLTADFAPLKSLDALQHNLPVQVTSFVGREQEVPRVKELLEKHRLVTLVGAGGMGKTRLALQTGVELLDAHRDGVWFVDLAPLSDPQLVTSAVASVFGLTESHNSSLNDALVGSLRYKSAVLILDNCEHLVEAVATLIEAVVRNCLGIRVLTTSRQDLRVHGEQVHRVVSLAVSEAIALFAERAGAVTDFRLSDDNAPTVAEICRKLDGIPLAIELAAPRLRMFQLDQLLNMLAQRLRVLTGGTRTSLPRQKTMRALIDWSYNLLSEAEQKLFNSLALFSGGWTLEAATAVCTQGDFDEFAVLDILSALVDKSLVAAAPFAAVMRYRLLESTREYALEKLGSGDECALLSRMHAQYYLEVARVADEAFSSTPARELHARLAPEVDNFRAALEWAILEGNDPACGAELAGSLYVLWFYGGLRAEGRRWVHAALEKLGEDGPNEIVARLWLVSSRFSDGREMQEAAERALAAYERQNNRQGAAHAMYELGWVLLHLGQVDDSARMHVRGLELAREVHDARSTSEHHHGLATALWRQGDLEGARSHFAQALAIAKTLDDEVLRAASVANLAELEFSQENVEQAVSYGSEALTLDLRGKNARNQAISYHNLAAYRIALGQTEEARCDAREAVRLAHEVQSEFYIAIAVQHLALIAASSGQAPCAARLLGWVDAVYERAGNQREPTESWGHEKLMVALREQLGEAEIAKLSAEGASWPEDQAVKEATKV